MREAIREVDEIVSNEGGDQRGRLRSTLIGALRGTQVHSRALRGPQEAIKRPSEALKRPSRGYQEALKSTQRH